MSKRVEVFGLLKRLKGFAPYGWTNVGQRHLTCVDFAEGAFQLLETSSSLNIIFRSCMEIFI